MRTGKVPQGLGTPINIIRLAWCATFFFAIWYAALSLGNHYYFRTFAFDLGIKNQAVFDYAHFRHNYNTVLPELGGQVNNLANHFEPILMLVSPLYWLFGNWTLLVVQWLGLLLGGWGMWRFALNVAPNKPFLALAAMLVFYGFWGIFSALAFDVHTNVLAAGFLPWLFLAFEKRKWIQASIWTLLIISCKENMPLWLFFVGLGLSLHYRKDKTKRLAGVLLSLGSLASFLIILKVFMPYFAQGKMDYLHFNYGALGNNMEEVVVNLLSAPWRSLELLFFPPPETLSSFGLKAKAWTWQLLLLSGAWIAVFRPAAGLMALPLLAQKMFNDDPMKWSPFLQYNAEFAPILAFALVVFVAKIKPGMDKAIVLFVLILGALSTWRSFGLYRPQAYMPEQLKVWNPGHWSRNIKPSEIRNLIQNIPQEASVSAHLVLVPHLANRSIIRTWPDLRGDKYIVLLNDNEVYYPLNEEEFIQSVQILEQNKAYFRHPSPQGILFFEQIP